MIGPGSSFPCSINSQHTRHLLNTMKRNSPIRAHGNIIRRSELFYAAGLLEGEACFCNSHGASIEVKMTDREPLAQLENIFGGRLRGPYLRKNPRHKPIFRWELHRNDGCISIMRLLYPLMSPRRQTKIQQIVSQAGNCPAHSLKIRREEQKAEHKLPI